MTAQLARHGLDFAVNVGCLSIWLVLLVCIFVPLERLFALHPVKIFRKQVGVDLAWYFINSLVPAAIMAVPLLMLARALRGLDPFGLYSTVALWPLWVRVPLVLVVSDFGAYWGHRALHAFPLLWRFHAIHHSVEEIDWLVSVHAHPFDIVFNKMSGLIPVYLLGLAQTSTHRIDPAVAVVTIIGVIWTYFIHANVRWRWGPLEWLISTPAFHHWHHTNDHNRDRNFAAFFPLIDRVFGTAWLPKYWPPVYGIDAKVPPTLKGQLLNPLDSSVRFWNNPQADEAKPLGEPVELTSPLQMAPEATEESGSRASGQTINSR